MVEEQGSKELTFVIPTILDIKVAVLFFLITVKPCNKIYHFERF